MENSQAWPHDSVADNSGNAVNYAGRSGGLIDSDSSSGGQIHALTSTRAIAAILVFIHHFGTGVFSIKMFPSFFRMGNIAVGYFFVLSGFVLYVSYRDRKTSYADYLKRRIGRIVPVYLLALGITIYLAVTFFNYHAGTPHSIKEILLSTVFLQAFVPGYALVLNLPGWTISVEMFFYVLFPLLLRLQKRSIRYFIFIAVVLFVGSQWLHLRYYADRNTLPDSIVDTVFFNPVIHLSQFLLGMVGGHIFSRIRSSTSIPRLVPFIVFVLILLAIAFRPANLSYQVGFIDPLFVLLIVSIAVTNPRTLNFRPLVYLGEISYGIYILQWPIYQYASHLNEQYFHIGMPDFFYCALAALILVAACSYHLLELPLNRKINRIGA